MNILKEKNNKRLMLERGSNIKNLAIKGISSLLVLSGGIGFSLQPYVNTNSAYAVVPAVARDKETLDVDALKAMRPNIAGGRVVAEGVTSENIINKLHEGSSSELEKNLENELRTVKDDDYNSLDKIARKYLGQEEITLPRNPELAKAWIRNALRVYMVFPYLFEHVYILPESKNNPEELTSGAAATFCSTIRHYKCLEKSDVALTRQVKGFNRKFTIVHELGHVIDFSFFFFNNFSEKFIQQAVEKVLEKDKAVEFKSMLEELKQRQEGIEKTGDSESLMACEDKIFNEIKLIVKDMSPYAAQSQALYRETFAEALVDVVINGKGATDLAKEIVKQLACEGVQLPEVPFPRM